MQALWLLSPCLDHVFDLSTLLALHRDPSSTKELPNAVSHARSHAKIASINGEFDRPTVYALLCSFTAFFVTGDNALVAWRRQGTTACTISMVRERETKKYRIEPQYVPRIHQQKPQTPLETRPRLKLSHNSSLLSTLSRSPPWRPPPSGIPSPETNTSNTPP